MINFERMNKLVLLFLLLLPCLNATAQVPLPAVKVFGLVTHPMTISVASLAEFKLQQRDSFAHYGEVTKWYPSFTGILLSDIITKAGIEMKEKKDRGKYYVVVTASDGYQVVFGYDEVMFGGAESAAYLMVKQNGIEPTKEYIMACPGDRSVGPRYIKMVRDIEVRKI